MVADAIGLVTLTLAALGEWVHARRVRRARHLAFGARGEAARWTRFTPTARTLGLAAFLWGCATLYETGADARVDPTGDRRRLILALDVSPSMDLRDAGPLAQQTRKQRAAEIVRQMLEPVSKTCRISLVAFYDQARPVVVDTLDRDIIENILDGLPLAQAFSGKRATTSVAAGVLGACELAAGWPQRCATLVVITDGDSEEADKIPVLPPAIDKVVLLGFGSVHGRMIEGHNSAQRTGFLRSAVDRLGRGHYHNCNEAPPPALLTHLVAQTERTRNLTSVRLSLAVVAVGAGGTGLALASLLLGLFGTAWRPGVPRRRGVAGRGASNPLSAGASDP